MDTRFSDYKVKIVLHDTSAIEGFIESTQNKAVKLKNAKVLNTGEKHATLEIEGKLINDLSVLEISPKDMKKSKSGKNAQKGKNTDTSPQSQPAQLVDDAIVFAQPGTKKKKNTNKQKQAQNATPTQAQTQKSDQNGQDTWSDDIAEIKQGEDFDFASNLALFNKREVFKDLKQQDKINYSDRLVGHNKVEAVKKVNYDNKEMVLDGKDDQWDSMDSFGEKKPAEKVIDAKKIKILQRNEVLENIKSPTSASSGGAVKFVLDSKPLTLSSPLQLSEIERSTTETFKVSSSLIAENASVGLSSLVLRLLGGRNRLANSHNKPPLVLLLVGNNKAGSRTLATGRRLANKGIRVVAFTLNNNLAEFLNENTQNIVPVSGSDGDVFYDAKEDFDDDVKDQLRMFVAFGGKMISTFATLQSFIAKLDSPLELVIDGLQGFDFNLTDLWGDEFASCCQLITWINSLQRVNIVSLDIPSGLDSGSGHYSLNSHHETEEKYQNLCIKSNVVASMGLPVVGLFHAYKSNLVDVGDWTHYLVDTGIPKKLFGTKNVFRKFDRKYFIGEESYREIELKFE